MICFDAFMTLIGTLKLFDQVFVMTQGGSAGATNTISTLIYANAFNLGRFGYGAALAVVLTIFVAAVSSVQYWMLSRQEA